MKKGSETNQRLDRLWERRQELDEKLKYLRRGTVEYEIAMDQKLDVIREMDELERSEAHR
jgi:hypothetical protein